MALTLLRTLVLVVLVALLFVVPADAQWFGVVAGAAAAVFLGLVEGLVTAWGYLRFTWFAVTHPHTKVRVSASYLYRIKLDSEYLLIQGRRFPQFQPVGGVYKALPDSSVMASKFAALDDQLVPIDPTSQHDLRLRIPSTKLVTFIRWFESGKDREAGPWREFYEELVTTGILPHDVFPYAQSRFVTRIVRPVTYSKYANSYEVLMADIFELAPTAEQLESLRSLKRSGHRDIHWASEDQIRRGGATPGHNQDVRIGQHAEWVLDA